MCGGKSLGPIVLAKRIAAVSISLALSMLVSSRHRISRLGYSDSSVNGPIACAISTSSRPECSYLSQTTSKEKELWYGIRNVVTEDAQAVADRLGGEVITINVMTHGAERINADLDLWQSFGYRAVVVFYTRETCSKRPWEWDGHEWVFPQKTIDALRGIAHHPALFAIYALHEPFDTGNECYWTVQQQQKLYNLLKLYTDGAPVWSDTGWLAIQESKGVELTDGICDYCATFHHRFRSDWSSKQCLTETLSWIDGDLDTQRRLMPNSQLVFLVQTFSLPDYSFPLRLPTVEELAVVRNHLCDLRQPLMYYAWAHSAYDTTLRDAQQLWPVVQQGCAYVTFLPWIVNRAD